MGDMIESLMELYSPGNYDYDSLTVQEKESDDFDRVMYTSEDKMILCQFEGAADPAYDLCKFFQDNRNAATYLLFMIRLTILESSANTFTMHEDVSGRSRTKDLRQRGDKTVLVKSPTTNLRAADTNEYSSVVDMHACVQKYQHLYTTELIERMGLKQRNLPDGLAIPALLNPLLGPMQVIVHTGLMNQTQYDRARRKLLRKMQDILDRQDPPLQDTGYESYDSEMGEIRRCIKNTNHQKAENELTLFEGFKRKKYRPEFD